MVLNLYLPNANHNEDTGEPDLPVLRHLAPSLDHVKGTVATRRGAANNQVHDDHAANGDQEAKESLPADNLDGLDGGVLKDPFFQHKLRGGKDLRAGNQKHAYNGARRIGETLAIVSRVIGVAHLLVWPDGARETDHGDAGDDADEREPLEQEEVAAEEDDGEEADKEDQRTTSHLVDGRGHEQQAGVHQRRAHDVADRRQREQDDTEALEQASLAAIVLVGVLVVGDDVGPVVGIDGLVLGTGGCGRLVGEEVAVQGHEPENEPAAHLANKHLGRLQDRLVKELSLLGIGIAVSHALHVLEKRAQTRAQVSNMILSLWKAKML